LTKGKSSLDNFSLQDEYYGAFLRGLRQVGKTEKTHFLVNTPFPILKMGGSMKSKSCVVCLAVVFLLMALAQGYAQEPKLDLEKVADKIIETMKLSDPVAVTNLYAPDAVMIQADLSTPLRGREALLEYYKAMYKAMPDFKSDLSVVAFSADTIVFEVVGDGTFTAPLATPEGEVPPTGKKISFKAAFFAKISPDGLIAEDRTYFDNLAFMKQLGVIK